MPAISEMEAKALVSCRWTAGDSRKLPAWAWAVNIRSTLCRSWSFPAQASFKYTSRSVGDLMARASKKIDSRADASVIKDSPIRKATNAAKSPQSKSENLLGRFRGTVGQLSV